MKILVPVEIIEPKKNSNDQYQENEQSSTLHDQSFLREIFCNIFPKFLPSFFMTLGTPLFGMSDKTTSNNPPFFFSLTNNLACPTSGTFLRKVET